jgi:hypothetical protein
VAGYRRAPGSRKLAALLLAISAAVHLSLVPGHANQPVTQALFLLDAVALAVLSLAAFALPLWRSLAAVLLIGNLPAYAIYVGAGMERIDPVGIFTKLVEVAALALVVIRLDARFVQVSKEVFCQMSLARIYAAVFGVVYTLVGLVGFAVSTTLTSANLIIFPVNLLHNVVHIVVGLAGLAALLTARHLLYARGMAVLFAILTLAGFLPQPLLGVVPIGGADIVLHAMTAILAGVAGWAYAPTRGVRRATT